MKAKVAAQPRARSDNKGLNPKSQPTVQWPCLRSIPTGGDKDTSVPVVSDPSGGLRSPDGLLFTIGPAHPINAVLKCQLDTEREVGIAEAIHHSAATGSPGWRANRNPSIWSVV